MLSENVSLDVVFSADEENSEDARIVVIKVFEVEAGTDHDGAKLQWIRVVEISVVKFLSLQMSMAKQRGLVE
jgi:hypothetical protein